MWRNRTGCRRVSLVNIRNRIRYAREAREAQREGGEEGGKLAGRGRPKEANRLGPNLAEAKAEKKAAPRTVDKIAREAAVSPETARKSLYVEKHAPEEMAH